MKTYMVAALFSVSLALAGCTSSNSRGFELTCNWAGYKN